MKRLITKEKQFISKDSKFYPVTDNEYFCHFKNGVNCKIEIGVYHKHKKSLLPITKQHDSVTNSSRESFIPNSTDIRPKISEGTLFIQLMLINHIVSNTNLLGEVLLRIFDYIFCDSHVWLGHWRESFVEQMTSRGGCPLSLTEFVTFLCYGCEKLQSVEAIKNETLSSLNISIDLLTAEELGLRPDGNRALKSEGQFSTHTLQSKSYLSVNKCTVQQDVVPERLYLILTWREQNIPAFHFPLPLVCTSVTTELKENDSKQSTTSFTKHHTLLMSLKPNHKNIQTIIHQKMQNPLPNFNHSRMNSPLKLKKDSVQHYDDINSSSLPIVVPHLSKDVERLKKRVLDLREELEASLSTETTRNNGLYLHSYNKKTSKREVAKDSHHLNNANHFQNGFDDNNTFVFKNKSFKKMLNVKKYESASTSKHISSCKKNNKESILGSNSSKYNTKLLIDHHNIPRGRYWNNHLLNNTVNRSNNLAKYVDHFNHAYCNKNDFKNDRKEFNTQSKRSISQHSVNSSNSRYSVNKKEHCQLKTSRSQTSLERGISWLIRNKALSSISHNILESLSPYKKSRSLSLTDRNLNKQLKYNSNQHLNCLTARPGFSRHSSQSNHTRHASKSPASMSDVINRGNGTSSSCSKYGVSYLSDQESMYSNKNKFDNSIQHHTNLKRNNRQQLQNLQSYKSINNQLIQLRDINTHQDIYKYDHELLSESIPPKTLHKNSNFISSQLVPSPFIYSPRTTRHYSPQRVSRYVESSCYEQTHSLRDTTFYKQKNYFPSNSPSSKSLIHFPDNSQDSPKKNRLYQPLSLLTHSRRRDRENDASSHTSQCSKNDLHSCSSQNRKNNHIPEELLNKIKLLQYQISTVSPNFSLKDTLHSPNGDVLESSQSMRHFKSHRLLPSPPPINIEPVSVTERNNSLHSFDNKETILLRSNIGSTSSRRPSPGSSRNTYTRQLTDPPLRIKAARDIVRSNLFSTDKNNSSAIAISETVSKKKLMDLCQTDTHYTSKPDVENFSNSSSEPLGMIASRLAALRAVLQSAKSDI